MCVTRASAQVGQRQAASTPRVWLLPAGARRGLTQPCIPLSRESSLINLFEYLPGAVSHKSLTVTQTRHHTIHRVFVPTSRIFVPTTLSVAATTGGFLFDFNTWLILLLTSEDSDPFIPLSNTNAKLCDRSSDILSKQLQASSMNDGGSSPAYFAASPNVDFDPRLAS